jgi:hypothetical protein
MVSELLQETGIHREHLQQARRQVLEGIVLLCQWQLHRMNAASGAEREPEEPAAPRPGRPGRAGRPGRGRRVPVE